MLIDSTTVRRQFLGLHEHRSDWIIQAGALFVDCAATHQRTGSNRTAKFHFDRSGIVVQTKPVRVRQNKAIETIYRSLCKLTIPYKSLYIPFASTLNGLKCIRPHHRHVFSYYRF